MTERLLLLSIVAPLIAGCLPPPAQQPLPKRCPSGMNAMVRDVLYFGRSIPGGGEVSDSAWTAFLAEVVTPAFPDGFTVTSGAGQWREASGKIASETSMMLIVLHPGEDASERKVIDIARRYRITFRQEAVLHEHSTACVSFEKGGA